MNPTYQKEKDYDYMILEAPGKPDGSEYQVRMVLFNQIPGLLRCKMRKIDGIPAFYYDITGKQPLSEAFEKKLMGKEVIESLFCFLEKAVDEVGRYLLEIQQLLLNPEFIFMETETGSFSFCYLPFYEGSLEEDFRKLAEYLLKRLDHSQEEAVLWGYEIYSSSLEEHFTIGRILESIHRRAAMEGRKNEDREEEGEPELEVIQEMSDEEQGKEEGKQVEGLQNRRKEEIPERQEIPVKKRNKVKVIGAVLAVLVAGGILCFFLKIGSLNFTQTGGILFLCIALLVYVLSVLRKSPKKEIQEAEFLEEWEAEDEEKTVMLGESLPEEYPVLVSLTSGERENIVVDQKRMTIGKAKGQADIYLEEPSVSRIHASLEKKQDGYYVKDLNSTNGTYLDGKKLLPDQEKKLEDGMEIGLASVHFYFHYREH